MPINVNMVDSNLLLPEDPDPRYVNSVFCHLKGLGAKQKGKRYEKITEDVLRKIGFKVEKPTSSQHDRIINGRKVEIKGSMLARDSNTFSFLQIRPNQEYDAIFFSMFYPDEIIIMEMDKKQIVENVKAGVFKSQHGGKSGNSGTYCYYGEKNSLLLLGAKEIC